MYQGLAVLVHSDRGGEFEGGWNLGRRREVDLLGQDMLAGYRMKGQRKVNR